MNSSTECLPITQGQNVKDLVDFVFGEKKKDLLFVWDQSQRIM